VRYKSFISFISPLCCLCAGLRRIGDLYKRHFEEAAEEVKRLEEAAAQAKEVGGKQIALLRDSLQALGEGITCI
jgi:hypothetical protein